MMDLEDPARRLVGSRAAYLDATPRDMRLSSRELASAQRWIAGLKEGDALRVDETRERVRFFSGDRFVGELSNAGQERLTKVQKHHDGAIAARVHEVFVQVTLTLSGADPLIGIGKE